MPLFIGNNEKGVKRMNKTLLALAMICLLFVPAAMAQTQIDPDWVYRWYYVPAESDQGYSIVCDQSGSIYVGGTTDTSASHSDWVIVKITPDGDTGWVDLYDSPNDGIDTPEYIGVDSDGYVYVCGDVGASSYAWKMNPCIIKYDASGNRQWVYQYNGPNSLDDRVEGFGIDGNNNIFIVGYTQIQTGSPGREDYMLIKLLPTGDTAWVRTLPTGNQTFDRLYDVAFDDSNYIYVTGGMTLAGNYDIAVIKYNQNGDTLWVKTYDGDANGNDVPYGIGVDDSGYVYVGGYTVGATQDYLALKYDANGNFIWDATFNGDGNGLDAPRDMTVDANGNVYIVGETTQNSQKDFLVVKFTNAGSVAWDFQYDSGGNMNELIFNNKALIKVDNQGYVYFGGNTYYVPAGLTLTNSMTFKLDPDGHIVWYNRYNGPGNDYDHIRAITLDNNANCFVTGYSEGEYGNWDLYVLKFGLGPESGALTGTVTDDVASPLEDVIVSVFDSGENLAGVDTTDVNGEFWFELTPNTYRAEFARSGYRDTILYNLEVTSGDTTEVELTMYSDSDNGVLTGTVTDDIASPLEDVIVSVFDSGESLAGTDTTDIDGEFSFELMPDTYRAEFAKSGYRDTTIYDIVVTSNDTAEVDLTMYAAGFEYLPGDVNMYNGVWPPNPVVGADATYLINFFRGFATSHACFMNNPGAPVLWPNGQPGTLFWASADVNGDCQVIGADVTKLINYLRGTTTLSWCVEYEPVWHDAGELPTEAPAGWPNCQE
jgi:hypothetical protein